MSTLSISQRNKIKSYRYVQLYLYLYCLFLQLCEYLDIYMNNTPSLNEINKTANMNPNLLTRHYKLKLMNNLMYIKYQNPKLKQSQIADQLNFPSSTIQRYRNDINMLSPCRISPNNTKKRSKKALNTDFDNNSHSEHDVKRPQMT